MDNLKQNFLIVHHIAQTIGAQQKAVTLLQIQMGYITHDNRLGADGPGDEVFARVCTGHFRSQLSPLHHHLHQAVIPGQLTDAAAAHEVSTAVAHMDHRDLPAPHQNGHQSGAHSVKFFKLHGLVKDREIGKLDSAAEHLLNLRLLHLGSPGPLDLLDKDIHCQSACNIAGLGAAHAVTDDTQLRVAVQFFNMECVLILFADAALIR